MLDPANKDLAARLRKLPGQILLAMVNGTAILVILAAILAMIATSKPFVTLNRVNHTPRTQKEKNLACAHQGCGGTAQKLR